MRTVVIQLLLYVGWRVVFAFSNATTLRNTIMKPIVCAAVLALIGLSPSICYAQQERNPNSITLDLKDAPIRTVIEMAFKQAGITNYVIDNNVAGFVTMTITDQPFENALKLIMRAATTPLTYIKENNVYIV